MYTHPVARLTSRWLCRCAVILVGVTPLTAHHVIAAKFDRTAAATTAHGDCVCANSTMK